MSEQSPKPEWIKVIAENIPDRIKERKRWICWKWVWDADKYQGKGGWDKPPINARTGRHASSTDSRTWAAFDYCLKAHQERKHDVDGIGFCLGKDEDKVWSGLDLEDCVVNSVISPAAMYLAGCLSSYSEISPSWQGAKVFTLGKIPSGGRSDKQRAFELFDGGRYFTVTGLRFEWSPKDIFDRTDEWKRLHATLFFKSQKEGVRLTDRELALECLNALDTARAADYHQWLQVGMALRSVSEDLLPDFDLWSRNSPADYQDGACAKKWASFQKSGIGLGSLWYWAKENGWKGPSTRPAGRQATHQRNGVDHPPVVTEGASNATIPEDVPADPLGWLRSYGVDVVKVVKIGSKRGVYDLVLGNKATIQMGTVSDVLSPRTIQSAIADSTRIVLPEIKRIDWRPIGAALIQMADHQDVGSDPQSELRNWIDLFAANNPGCLANDDDTRHDQLVTHGFSHDGQGTLYINLDRFLAALLAYSATKNSRAEVIQRLYREGFCRDDIQARVGGKNKHARCWKSQTGYHEID